ncbi:hypothetical protein AVEN_198584-1 [Araneus ventricosus]|uniref:Uncharacterized protein n=1 Tax=Araneus ventricosus TaxID=182803 RepID=A0A4Y2U4J2_ARAVE|nr:hypothetical protein AVEN_198584-1 [Araneus ventricosus]
MSTVLHHPVNLSPQLQLQLKRSYLSPAKNSLSFSFPEGTDEFMNRPNMLKAKVFNSMPVPQTQYVMRRFQEPLNMLANMRKLSIYGTVNEEDETRETTFSPNFSLTTTISTWGVDIDGGLHVFSTNYYGQSENNRIFQTIVITVLVTH